MSNPTIVSRISDAVKRVFGKRSRSAETTGSDQVGAAETVTGSAAPGPVGAAEETGSSAGAAPGPVGQADPTAAGSAKEAEDIRKAAEKDAAGPAEPEAEPVAKKSTAKKPASTRKAAAKDATGPAESEAVAAETETALEPVAKKSTAKKSTAKKPASSRRAAAEASAGPAESEAVAAETETALEPVAGEPVAKPVAKKSTTKKPAKSAPGTPAARAAAAAAEAKAEREALVPPEDEATIAEELNVAEAKTQVADPELLAEIRKGEIPGSAALAVPNYDELTIASMRARLRKLTLVQVRELRAYEKANADRESFMKAFDNRIAKIEAENNGV